MTPLTWYPAPYTAGAIDGAGLQRLLGASVHDRLSLLVRETLQNSWDASRTHDGQRVRPGRPCFRVSLRSADSSERAALIGLIGEPATVPGLPLGEALESDRLLLLEISDRGTSGLGGPIDPSAPVGRGTPTDFVDLMFNIGAPQDTKMGGGTFGFGKIASYAVSSASTVLVHSKPLHGIDGVSPGEQRLIASGIGEGFEMDGRRFTGRHWWGAADQPPLPVVGGEAESMASEVFELPFAAGDTGTSILILQPDLEDLDVEQATTRIVSSILWNGWPKLLPVPRSDEPPMDISVVLDGEEIDVPDPRTTRPFIGFSAALQEVRRQQAGGAPRTSGWHVPEDRPRHTRRMATRSVDSKSPRAHVGEIAGVETLNMPTVPSWQGDDEEREASGVGETLHHLALMRGAELVVTYVPGPEHPDADRGVEWSGVFKCAPEVDRHFALAEPPAHDEWLVGGLETHRAKVIVRRGREHGPRTFFGGLFQSDVDPSGDSESPGVAHVVQRHLTGLVDGGLGVGPNGSPKGASKRSSGPSVQVTAAQPTQVDGRSALVVDFSAPEGTELRAVAEVKFVSGRSGDQVRLLGWSGPSDDAPRHNGEAHRLTAPSGRVWFEQPTDATVSVRLVVD